MSTVADTSLKELQDILAAKNEKFQRFVANGIKIDGENVEVKGADADAARSLMAEMSSLQTAIQLKQFGSDFQNWVNKTPPSMAVQQAAFKAGHVGSVGEAFTESKEFKDFAKSGLRTMNHPYETEMYDIASKRGVANMNLQYKDVWTGLNSHNVPMGVGTVVQFDPLVPRGQRTARIRDLFPVARTAANLIDFFRVLGFAENQGSGNANTVPEYSGGTFGLKPKSNLQFFPDSAPVRIIAHWEAVHRNIIEDVPSLQATINNELLYGLALKEDDQLLNGDGAGVNLRGLLNTPGIQSYTPGAAEWKSDSLRRAATLAMLAYYPPTGYVLHPNDWEDIELQRGTTNDHYAITTNVSIGATPQIWRLPVVETPAIAEGTFLTGAFGTGAQVYDRQLAAIRIAEQHDDFFVRDAVAVLCEERIALAVKRPEAFVKGSYQTS